MGKRALVTGGAGFIGSHLVDRLVSNGWSVKVVDNFSSGDPRNIKHHQDNPNVTVIRRDLKSPPEVLEVTRDVDTVFHFAANPEVRVSTTNPKVHFNENIVATFNLLEAMRRNDVKELVFASSSSVYGEPESIPVNEDAPIRPVSVYGASKAACESLIHSYAKLYGIRSLILRYANVIGPRLRHGVIHDLLMKLKRNRARLKVLGDGSQTRSYIYIDDAIEATLTTYEALSGWFEVYNVASEDWITVSKVVQVILEELDLTSTQVVYRPVLHGVGWPGDVKRIALDIARLKRIRFNPRMGSVEAVKKTVRKLSTELLVSLKGT